MSGNHSMKDERKTMAQLVEHLRIRAIPGIQTPTESHIMDKLKFNDLARMTDREMQVLLGEIDQKDLVVSLNGASRAVTDKVLNNMSDRVGKFITEEVGFLGQAICRLT